MAQHQAARACLTDSASTNELAPGLS
jgi:hypothetical protein